MLFVLDSEWNKKDNTTNVSPKFCFNTQGQLADFALSNCKFPTKLSRLELEFGLSLENQLFILVCTHTYIQQSRLGATDLTLPMSSKLPGGGSNKPQDPGPGRRGTAGR